MVITMNNNFKNRVKEIVESICYFEQFQYDNESIRKDYEFEEMLDFIDNTISEKDKKILAIDYKYDDLKMKNFTMIKYEGNIIGFLYKDKKLIDMIYIDPKYRNKGICTDLLRRFSKSGDIAKTKTYNKKMCDILKKNDWKIIDKNSETITWKK